MGFLIPETPRAFPGRRGVKILLRSAHVLAAGVLCGAYVFGVGLPARTPWLIAAVVSGLLIVLLDLYESGAFLLQVRGLVVAVKIATLVALPWVSDYAGWVLAAIVVVSVLSSHAPAKIRYYVILGGGRITGAGSRG